MHITPPPTHVGGRRMFMLIKGTVYFNCLTLECEHLKEDPWYE